MRRTPKLLAALTLALSGAGAQAQPFEMSWTTVDGGGGTITGGTIEACSTIGQHDAGPLLAAGSFELEPGYWPGVFSAPPPPSCPADLNGDGILDNGDIATFLSFFLGGNLGADMNGDGLLDNGDIATFLSLFLAGCP